MEGRPLLADARAYNRKLAKEHAWILFVKSYDLSATRARRVSPSVTNRSFPLLRRESNEQIRTIERPSLFALDSTGWPPTRADRVASVCACSRRPVQIRLPRRTACLRLYFTSVRVTHAHSVYVALIKITIKMIRIHIENATCIFFHVISFQSFLR